jgi:Tat protein secretion system quality control protein TatD with DNase activity
MISAVVDEMAAIKGETPEKIIEVTSGTARRVFGL